MLNSIIMLFNFLSVASGVVVLYFGHWQNFRLKFIATTISTTCGLGITMLKLRNPQLIDCTGTAITCADFSILICMVYVSLFIFHVATAFDTIGLKWGGRRASDRGAYNADRFRKGST